MAIISLIAAIDEMGGLGFDNQLLCYLPADLQHFKSITMGKPVIMGRKTFESIGKPLPGRKNIVLTHSAKQINGVTVVDSLINALSQNEGAEELIIIGGAGIFAQSMELADRIYLTRIHHYFKADVFFPEIDENVWFCQNSEFHAQDEKNGYDYTYYTYVKIDNDSSQNSKNEIFSN
jgi:dihydrofolate reductase